jgi:hypothetical protein
MFDLASCLEATNRGRLDDWIDRYLSVAAGLSDPRATLPLIIEWRSETLSIRDGNHRAGWR